MKLKNILSACLACCTTAAVLTSCSADEDAFFTVSENDSPRILNQDFPRENKDDDDSPIKFTINRDEPLNFEVIVTPANYTTVKWLLDGHEVFEGKSIDRCFEAGNYELKILAVTKKGKETSRTGKLEVKPLDGDPQAGSDAAERLLISGSAAKLHGTNMSAVKQVGINGQQVDATYNETEDCIEYTLPEDLPEGNYRLSLIDEQGIAYGGGPVTVIATPTLSKATYAGMSNDLVTLEGYYLTDVTTVTIGGKEATIEQQDAHALIVRVPELEVGDFEMTATTTAGQAVHFIKDGELADQGFFIVAAETVVWTGNYYVSWEVADGNPTKEWREISQDEFAQFEVGHTLTISLQVKPDTYHKYAIGDWSWNLMPGQAETEFYEDTDIAIEITQELKNRVAAKAFCIHGHGFYVTRVTYK